MVEEAWAGDRRHDGGSQRTRRHRAPPRQDELWCPRRPWRCPAVCSGGAGGVLVAESRVRGEHRSDIPDAGHLADDPPGYGHPDHDTDGRSCTLADLASEITISSRVRRRRLRTLAVAATTSKPQ